MAVLSSESSSLSNEKRNVAGKVLDVWQNTSCTGHEVMHDLCEAAYLMHRCLRSQFRSHEICQRARKTTIDNNWRLKKVINKYKNKHLHSSGTILAARKEVQGKLENKNHFTALALHLNKSDLTFIQILTNHMQT